jgi:hypothetical protein
VAKLTVDRSDVVIVQRRVCLQGKTFSLAAAPLQYCSRMLLIMKALQKVSCDMKRANNTAQRT